LLLIPNTVTGLLFLISEESDSVSHISYRPKYFPVNGPVNLVVCGLALQG